MNEALDVKLVQFWFMFVFYCGWREGLESENPFYAIFISWNSVSRLILAEAKTLAVEKLKRSYNKL